MKTISPSPPLETANTQELLAQIVGPAAASKLLTTFTSLSQIAGLTETEMTRLAGLTPRRSLRIKAAMLLAKRLLADIAPAKPQLDTPDRVADVLREDCRGYQVETFHLLLLNTRRRLIRIEKVSQGTLDTLLVHAREIFKPAILWNAAAIILAHNLCVAAHKLWATRIATAPAIMAGWNTSRAVTGQLAAEPVLAM